MFDEQNLREMALFLRNTDRDDLEKAGVIQSGPAGSAAWEHFNNSFDVFLIKLTPEKRAAFADMLNERVMIKRLASFITATGVNHNPSHAARMESRRVSHG